MSKPLTPARLTPALAQVLATLADTAELLGVAEVADLAAEASGRLQAQRLEVAVVGEFKRGKSSLINALLGQDELPVGVLPLTAVPTVLEQGEDGLVVEFADGRQEQHRLDQVDRFVTEEANPANHLGVTQMTARLRGATSEQLGEAARQLGARLQRHQAALAASLTAAVERGGGLLAEAEDHRRWRTAQLDRAANLLHEVTVGLQREPTQAGAYADSQSPSKGRAHQRRTLHP